MYTYISGRSFPSDEVVDRIQETWGLDLLNIDALPKTPPAVSLSELERQLSLFDPPVRLTNEGVEIVLERKGAAIAVGITISPDVKVA
jgi:hypothetical protein